MIEQVLQDWSQADREFGRLPYGTSTWPAARQTDRLGEDHDPETHLIPILLQVALGQRPHVTLFGKDYPTRDGTCIRDYVHVDDLCDAHVRL